MCMNMLPWKLFKFRSKGHLAKLHSLEASYFQLAAQYAWNLFSYQISFPNKTLVQKLDVFSCICMFYLHFFTLHGWGRGGDVDSIIDMSCPTFWKENEWKKSDIWGIHKELFNEHIPHMCIFSTRRIYIANFAIFKIETFWSYHLHLREKSWSFSFTKLRNFFGWWCACAITGYSACIAACSMHEGRGYRYTFQRACVASSPEVPKVTWWKIMTFLGYHLHWLTSLETSRHFRKIALRLGIFLAMFRECLCIVARQLAPKCHEVSKASVNGPTE